MGTPDYEQLAKLLGPQASQAPSDPRSTATHIREQIERKTIGCGCLGLLVMALFVTYALVSSWAGSGDLALVSAAVLAAMGVASVYMRGHHVWTAVAWLGLTLVGLGAIPMLFVQFYPKQAFALLPAWMVEPGGPTLLALAGLGSVAMAVFRMRNTITTPESVYAIQFHAAAQQIDTNLLSQQLAHLRDHLKRCGQVGLWPLGAEYIQMGDAQDPPQGHQGRCLLPLLAIQVVPSNNDTVPWTGRFGQQPWLNIPDTPGTTVPQLGPLGVGILLFDEHHLRFIPLRRHLEPITAPLIHLTRYRFWINALEFEVQQGDSTWEYAFEVTHGWRVLALAAFLRVYHTDIGDEREALWATHLRDGMSSSDTAMFERTPTTDTLEQAIEALRSTLQTPTEAIENALELLQELASHPHAPFRQVAGRLVQVWQQLLTDTDIEDLLPEFADLDLLLGLFPNEAWPDEASDLLDDLRALALLQARRWGQLGEQIEQWTARDLEWLYGEDAEPLPEGVDEDEALADSKQALADLVQLARRRRAQSTQALALATEARKAYPGSLLIDALTPDDPATST